MREHVFTALFPFCGLGGGALGFRDADTHLLGTRGRFRVLGGIDNDAESCRDFERLVGAPAICRDVQYLTSAELRQIAPDAPDVVFLSPPCKGSSGLLSAEKARSAKYQRMNKLALRWTELMLRTWDRPPRLVLLENVPRIKTRAAGMLRQVRSLLRGTGSLFHDGFHDCGALGGLAQIRRRYLLVSRDPARCPALLYQPPLKRVRGCGEVLGQLPLPLPGSTAGGPMHRLPRLSWLNWVRLSLIPAGGDWRDLEGVLRDGQPRREVFRRHHVQRWEEPSDTVAGSGSNGPSAVADPRFERFGNSLRVDDWNAPTGTVVAGTHPSNGGKSVADPRVGARLGEHWNKMRVEDWGEPSHTVTGSDRVGSGAPSVADPRALIPEGGAFDHGYGVLRWDEPSSTVAGGSQVGQGAYSVADLRLNGPYYNGTFGVMSWEDAAGTITGNARHDTGRFTVADPRKPPPTPQVIVAADGTWHRPLTTLELAALQGFPTEIDGEPLVLSGGSHSAWRERIGNAVPPPAAQAIAERMLVALLEAELGAAALHGSDTPVWVERELLA